MATIQIRVDDNIKEAADELFSSLGLDMPTAVRIFLSAALENNGIPFVVKRVRKPNAELLEAMDDVNLRRNLNGPFSSSEQALESMLKD